MHSLDMMLDKSLWLRRDASPLAIAAVSLAATATAMLRSDPAEEWINTVVLLGVCAVSIWGWHRANRLWHFIADTPLSKVETAAQGYVELQGACDLYGKDSQGFASGPPAIWQRFTIHRATGGLLDSGVTTEPFVLTDGTGSCVVNPEGAIVMSSSRRSWTEGNNRFSVRFIRPGATLYILGALSTTGGSNTQRNHSVEMGNTLRQWKQDQAFMLSEFDANRDGEIDAHEWEAARKRASVVVARQAAERSLGPVTHLIEKPRDGSPFLISDKDPAPIGRIFYALSWLNLLLAIGAFYLALNLM